MTTPRQTHCRSAAETETFGEMLAAELKGGDVVLLEAELAAGKTTFVKGIVRGLGGKAEEVSSPTFILIQSYDCSNGLIRAVHHVDLYRLEERIPLLREIGLEEILSDTSAVIAVEWPKKSVATWIPVGTRVWRVSIVLGKDDVRSITITPPDGSDSYFQF